MTTPSARLKKHNFAREKEMDRVTGLGRPKTVSIPLALLTELLIEAAQSNRAWLRDFDNDSVQIDADLYEVLLAYQAVRRVAA